MRITRVFLSLAALTAAGLAFAATMPPAELPVATFFQKPNVSQLTFSPDGKRIACLVPFERRMNLAVIDLEKKTKNLLTNFKDNDVGSLLWANNDRLVFTKDTDGQAWPAVFGINFDGSDPVMLASGAAEFDTSRQANTQFRGLLARLPDDPKNILVLGNLSGAQGPDVCTMNLKTSRMTVEVANPGWVRRWILDRQRNVRIGIAQKGQTITVLLRDPQKGTFTEIHSHEADTAGWTPLAFDGDDRTLFVSSNIGRTTSAVYRYDTQTRMLGDLVHGDPIYDVGGVVWDEARNKIVAISINADRTRYHWLDAESEALQRRLDASLPDTLNRLQHAAPDGSRRLILSTSDRDPGVYYLFDSAKKKIEELAVLKPTIDPDKMAPMKHLTFKARDGLVIHAYLTLPVGREPKKLPFIIHPHGGPYGIRDSWGFNPEVQFYANRGYAIMQVNFRGSGGYGDAFERAGWKKWGLEMQNDLTDAVKWAIAEGIADPRRVVISGASYGGYATMAGLTFTPELYCAGINYLGRVDLAGKIRDQETQASIHWFKTRIGDIENAADRERLRATSPVYFAEKINAPVLMAYGRNDRQVRIDQGFDMAAALKKAGKTHELIIEEKEGHGFRKEELAIAFYTKVDEFLKKYTVTADVKVGPVKVIDMPARKEK